MIANSIGLVLFPAMMAIAASSDLLTMTISNRVSLILIGGFFVLALLMGMSGPDILWHVAAAGVVLVVTFGFFCMGWIGGGDAKLAAVTALWFGFAHLPAYLIYASLLGGALTLLLLWFRALPLPPRLACQDWVERLNRSGAAYLTPAILEGRWIARVSIGALTTEREHVAALWDAMRAAALG